MSGLEPLPKRPSTASIRIRSIPRNANPTPVVSTSEEDRVLARDFMEDFEFVRDEFTAEKLQSLCGKEDLHTVLNLEIEVDTTRQSIAHFGEVMPNLETLKLVNSRVESFRDLGTRLRNLKILWVTRCGITELDGIVALAGLQELYIAFNDISDLSPLALHESLAVLDLESNNVYELDQIEQLSTCAKLRDLTLDGNPISKRKAYRRIIGSLIPQLDTLDYAGVSTKERRPLDDEILAKLRRKCKESGIIGTRSGTPHKSRSKSKDNDIGSSSFNGTSPAVSNGAKVKRNGSLKSRGDVPTAISELQMVAEAIKWGSISIGERAKSATGSPRPRRELPRRPYSSSDHVELSAQLSQYKWHRQHLGRSAQMLELLEEIGVEETSEKSSSSGLTMGSNVTFVGNPIMAMRQRRMAVGDSNSSQITSVLDAGKRSFGFRKGTEGDNSSDIMKKDFKTWNLDTAVAKLRVRAGRPASRPSTAASTPRFTNEGSGGTTPASFSYDGSAFNDTFTSDTTQNKKAEVMLLGTDRHSRATALDSKSHRLMNSSRGGNGTSGILAVETSPSMTHPNNEDKVVSPGPISLFTARHQDRFTNSIQRTDTDGSFVPSSNAKELPRHDTGEDVESDVGDVEDVEDETHIQTYKDLPEDQVVAMLKKKPKKVPELQTRESFRIFFEGCPKSLMEDLLNRAYLKYEDSDKRVQKRLKLLAGVLAD